MSHRRIFLLALFALVLALAAAACGGGDDGEEAPAPAGEETGAAEEGGVEGSISLMGIWTAQQQEAIQEVIAGFTEANPNAEVKYIPAGDQIVTRLSTAIEGGNPPELATVAQPGTIADYAERGAIQPLDFVRDVAVENFGEDVVATGSVDGTFYGLLFKAANKSTVWYNVQTFEGAGVEPADNWDDFIANSETIGQSGVPAYSIGAASGWTLTDLFENIYIRTAGPELYDQLSNHEIPWTHESVKEALTEMAKIVGDSDNIAGGTDGALQTDFDQSVAQVFSESPKASMVIEGDFVPGIPKNNPLEPETGYNVFTFPAINDSPSAVIGGGDFVVMFKDNPVAQAFVEYLATPEAAEIWAKRGGFSSANKQLDASVYPDEITRTTASAIAEAEVFRFDLSDLQPSAFGATEGQGLWKLFQDFVANPDDVDGIAQQMERAAAAAFK